MSRIKTEPRKSQAVVEGKRPVGKAAVAPAQRKTFGDEMSSGRTQALKKFFAPVRSLQQAQTGPGPWTQPPLSDLGDPSKGPEAMGPPGNRGTINGQPISPTNPDADWGSRIASAIQRSGTLEIGLHHGPNGYANGAGQTVVQMGGEDTTAIDGRYIAPGATQTMTTSLDEAIRRATPGGTITYTMQAADPAALLAAVRAGNAMVPPITFVIPTVVTSMTSTPEALAFLDQLKAAGAIVVGTSTAVGGPGQPCIGNPTVKVDSHEHSSTDSIVGNAIALLKQQNPNITNAEIARVLAAGSTSGYLNVEAMLDAAGITK